MKARFDLAGMTTAEIRRQMFKLFQNSPYEGEYLILRQELLGRKKRAEKRRARYLRSARGRKREARA